MGLFDQIGGALKGVMASELANNAPAFINAALSKTDMGDLQGLVAQLQQNGLGEQVSSWLSNGPNLKVTPEQIKSALGAMRSCNSSRRILEFRSTRSQSCWRSIFRKPFIKQPRRDNSKPLKVGGRICILATCAVSGGCAHSWPCWRCRQRLRQRRPCSRPGDRPICQCNSQHQNENGSHNVSKRQQQKTCRFLLRHCHPIASGQPRRFLSPTRSLSSRSPKIASGLISFVARAGA